jgi:hypothetical protein
VQQQQRNLATGTKILGEDSDSKKSSTCKLTVASLLRAPAIHTALAICSKPAALKHKGLGRVQLVGPGVGELQKPKSGDGPGGETCGFGAS